jgi:hypothetical protein
MIVRAARVGDYFQVNQNVYRIVKDQNPNLVRMDFFDTRDDLDRKNEEFNAIVDGALESVDEIGGLE